MPVEPGKSTSRGDAFYSLGVLPCLMGLGHLVPAIGAIHVATGAYQFPFALLGMIGTAAALVDACDTHKDLPTATRPRRWVWTTYLYSLWAIILVCSWLSGVRTAATMYRFSLIGLGWGTPCIPLITAKGVHLSPPKTIFREAKSIVVAVCMGYVTADTSVFYFCHNAAEQCNPLSVQTRSLCLAVLYQFFRETACDVRDLEEDAKNEMRTLPVRLGKNNTLLFMFMSGTLLDALFTQAIAMSTSGVELDFRLLLASVLRVGVTMGAYNKILQYPRWNSWAWGSMSLLGLLPVLWAQASLILDRSIGHQ